jgi:predicted ATPase
VIVERVICDLPPGHAASTWPFTLAPVRQLASEGMRFRAAVTFLVGENGSGKSTIVEAISEGYGLDARGGRSGRKCGCRETPARTATSGRRCRETPGSNSNVGTMLLSYRLGNYQHAGLAPGMAGIGESSLHRGPVSP